MTPPISSMLFATDLSRNATFALRRAVALARVTGAKIHILHVCEELTNDAKTTLMMFLQDETARRNALSRRVELARETLAKRQENFWAELPENEQGTRSQVASSEVIEGFAADEILRHARAKGCDLIVLGAHEHAEDFTFLGTVARRVLRRANIPTLVVPYQPDR